MQEFGWEVFNHHPPYILDLASSDFNLFLQLKKFLSGHRQHFQNLREAEMSVIVVPIPDGRVLRHGIQKLVSWYDKSLNSGGEYVEKLLNTYIICSNKLGFVSLNGPRETYFVDALHIYIYRDHLMTFATAAFLKL